MSEYKLTYFGVRGRGEPIRMLLTLAGQKFEDVKVGHVEWPTMKASELVCTNKETEIEP